MRLAQISIHHLNCALGLSSRQYLLAIRAASLTMKVKSSDLGYKQPSWRHGTPLHTSYTIKCLASRLKRLEDISAAHLAVRVRRLLGALTSVNTL